MLARATVRQKELAIRKALGAARGRVLRQLLAESVLLAAVSVVVGLGIAAACFGYLSRLAAGHAAREREHGARLARARADDRRRARRRCFVRRRPGLRRGAARLRRARSAEPSARTARGRGGCARRSSWPRSRSPSCCSRAPDLLLRSYANVLAVEPDSTPKGCSSRETVLPHQRYPARRVADGVLPRRARAGARVARRRERRLHELRAAPVQGRPLARLRRRPPAARARGACCATSRAIAARARAISRLSAFR